MHFVGFYYRNEINVFLDVTPFIVVEGYLLSRDRICVHFQRVHTHWYFIWTKLGRGRTCSFTSAKVKNAEA